MYLDSSTCGLGLEVGHLAGKGIDTAMGFLGGSLYGGDFDQSGQYKFSYSTFFNMTGDQYR